MRSTIQSNWDWNLTNNQITYLQITDRDRHSFLDPSPLRRDSVMWMYGDSVSEQFFWGVRPRPLCTHVFKWCGHTYNWIYQLNGNYRLKIFREKATSAVAGFHAGPLSWSNVFSWREENLSTRGKSLGASETQQQTQPTYDSWPESNPGHIGGRRTLSPLRPPCSPILTKHFFLFRKLLTTALLCFLLFAAGNETVAKNADDNLDFNFMRVASEVLDVISKPFFDKNSVILLNAGLHYLESTNFSNYQKTISSLIRLFQETKMVTRADGNLLFPGEMIWRTTTALNKEKLDGKHIQARRFLTYQVWSVFSEGRRR